MTTKDRIFYLLFSLLAPTILVVAMYGTAELSVRYFGNDRAMVWADGSALQLQQAGDLLTNSGSFGDGRVFIPDGDYLLPAGCGTGARELSVGGLHLEQAHAARDFIEALITEAGARICSSNHFSINELPDQSTRDSATLFSIALMQSGALSLGFVLACYWAFVAQQKLPLPGTSTLALGQQTFEGLLGAFAAVFTLQAIALIGRLASGAPWTETHLEISSVGVPVSLAIVVVMPLVEEIAFRAWLITLAERSVGPFGAAAISSLAYAAASLPTSVSAGLGALCLGIILSALFIRTRSIWACFLANALVSASAFVSWPG